MITHLACCLLCSFFYRQFEGEFNRCLKNLTQVRHIIAFPVACGEFLNSTSPFCPEEVHTHTHIHVAVRMHTYCTSSLLLCTIVYTPSLPTCSKPTHHTPPSHTHTHTQRINIGDRAVNSINHFLELIAKEIKTVLGQLSSERMNLDDQLRPANASAYYNQVGGLL